MELVIGKRFVGEFSMDGYRVKTKKIITKDRRGTEDYAVWRNPELAHQKES
jgi:hypothetical protein